MQSRKTNSVLEAFDSFLNDVNTALAGKSFLEEDNRGLRLETEQLMLESKRKEEMISIKEEEIARLLEKSFLSMRADTTQINDSKNEALASAQLVDVRYEVGHELKEERFSQRNKDNNAKFRRFRWHAG